MVVWPNTKIIDGSLASIFTDLKLMFMRVLSIEMKI